MYLKTLLRYVLFFAAFVTCVNTWGQDFSYVYIQGDKQTPFYVKFEDEMLPRYGKNYYIIPELAPGPMSIQVLFQQNQYPPQKFVVQVPENGFRGFLLTRKSEQFFLYDIHQNFYLPAGNKAEDDHAPVIAETSVTTVQEPTPPPVPEKPVAVTKNKPAKQAKPAARTGTKTGEGPQFLGNIELGNRQNGQGTLPGGKVVKNKVAIINSDCPTAMDNSVFQNLYKKVSGKYGTDRLKLLLDRLDECFTTNQVRIMAKLLSSDAERFTYFKKVYAKVTDQSAFVHLEKMLTTEDWKQYFREMVQ